MRALRPLLHLLPCLVLAAPAAAQDLRASALETMRAATTYLRAEVATEGGTLWDYSHDLALRDGEGVATETQIWVQPPGTPETGMAFLDAWAATGDSLYRDGAIAAARALAWGQLASGGWDYRIDFDPEASRAWHYRRDLEAGDTETGDRRNRTTFDDDVSQSALRLLMRVDTELAGSDADIRAAVDHALTSFLRAQYPNGAWPQRYTEFPDPEDYPVLQASYPDSWPRQWPHVDYRDYYTFNDNAVADVIDVFLEAHRTYGDERFLQAALRGGDFMILAQMPEPQPAWAQQYDRQMQPAWARRFEPPAVTGGESFGVMRALIDLHIETGQARFLEPIGPALAWARRSLLPDGRLARFYELRTNVPLYFVRDTYELTYSDADMPTHYSFKVGGVRRIESIERSLERLRTEGRETILERRRTRFGGRVDGEDEAQVRAIVEALDEQGRWLQDGELRARERGGEPVQTRILSMRTFSRNLRALARYVALTDPQGD